MSTRIRPRTIKLGQRRARALTFQMPERFGVRLHACVLMDNPVHLLIETPEADQYCR